MEEATTTLPGKELQQVYCEDATYEPDLSKEISVGGAESDKKYLRSPVENVIPCGYPFSEGVWIGPSESKENMSAVGCLADSFFGYLRHKTLRL